MKDVEIFLGRKEKQRDFLGCEKRTKGFFLGMLKKSCDFFEYTNSEVVIFLGIKYEPLSEPPPPPPPPSLKFVSRAPGLEINYTKSDLGQTKLIVGFLQHASKR